MGASTGIKLLIGAAIAAAVFGGGVAVQYEWQKSANYKKWSPVLQAAARKYGLPAGFLEAQANQESGYQSAVIDGTQASSAGALGILQLMPQWFSTVQGPTPFSDTTIAAQIDQAAAYDAKLYREFSDWGLVLMAYNWGPGAVSAWLNNGAPAATVPTQTSNYAASILANVPAVRSAYA